MTVRERTHDGQSSAGSEEAALAQAHAELRGVLAGIEGRLGELDAQVSTLERLRQQVERLTAENRELHRRLAEAATATAQSELVTSELHRLQVENERLLVEAERMRLEQTNAKARHDAEARRLREAQTTLEGDLAGSFAEVERLRALVRQAERSVADADELATLYSAEAEAARAEAAEARAQGEAARTEAEEARRETTEVRQTLHAVQSDLAEREARSAATTVEVPTFESLASLEAHLARHAIVLRKAAQENTASSGLLS